MSIKYETLTKTCSKHGRTVYTRLKNDSRGEFICVHCALEVLQAQAKNYLRPGVSQTITKVSTK